MNARAREALVPAGAREGCIRIDDENVGVVARRLPPAFIALERLRLGAVRLDATALHAEREAPARIGYLRRARLERVGTLQGRARGSEIAVVNGGQCHRHGVAKIACTNAGRDIRVSGARRRRERVERERRCVVFLRGIELVARLVGPAGGDQCDHLFHHPRPLHALLGPGVVRCDGECHLEARPRRWAVFGAERRLSRLHGRYHPRGHGSAQRFQLGDDVLVLTPRLRVALRLHLRVACREAVHDRIVVLPAPHGDALGFELGLRAQRHPEQPLGLALVAREPLRVRRRCCRWRGGRRCTAGRRCVRRRAIGNQVGQNDEHGEQRQHHHAQQADGDPSQRRAAPTRCGRSLGGAGKDHGHRTLVIFHRVAHGAGLCADRFGAERCSARCARVFSTRMRVAPACPAGARPARRRRRSPHRVPSR